MIGTAQGTTSRIWVQMRGGAPSVRCLSESYDPWQLAEGVAFVTPSAWAGETVLRWCIVNPRTTVEDLAVIVASLSDE